MKIPFERTIAGAYRFTFTNILSIVGIGWFPFLLLGALATGLVFLWLPQLAGFFAAIGQSAGAPAFDKARFAALLAPLLGTYVLVIAAAILVQAMVNVGLMRKALGQHPGPVFIFFSLGSQVWRLIGSYLLLMILAWGAMAVLALGIAAISFGVQKASAPAQPAVTAILAVLAFLWFVYAAVRVTFFIPAVVVAENHIGIRRAWHLGKGNFWRIVGIVLIVILPLSMAVNTVASSIMQMALGAEYGSHMAAATPAESRKMMMDVLHAFAKAWPYFAVLQLVSFILQSGLMAGAAANAYNLVTGGESIPQPPTKASA